MKKLVLLVLGLFIIGCDNSTESNEPSTINCAIKTSTDWSSGNYDDGYCIEDYTNEECENKLVWITREVVGWFASDNDNTHAEIENNVTDCTDWCQSSFNYYYNSSDTTGGWYDADNNGIYDWKDMKCITFNPKDE